MKAMLLAAGLGTRLRPYTDTVPKPRLPILNVPLLHWSADLLRQAGATSLTINACYKHDQIHALAERLPGFSGTQISKEEPEPLGSGGGIRQARKWLEGGGSFLVANGDEVLLPSSPDAFARLRGAHALEDALATIYVMRHPLVGTTFGGVWADRNGRVQGFGRGRPVGAPATVELEPLHYVGLQILSDRVFRYLPEGKSNLLYDALAAGIAAGERVLAIIDECQWHETGNALDFLAASAACIRGFGAPRRHFALERIARVSWPSFDVRSTAELGLGGTGDWPLALERCRADGGAAVVGDRCAVADGVRLRGACAIGDGASLEAGAWLENCVVLPGARIPRGARLTNEIYLPEFI